MKPDDGVGTQCMCRIYDRLIWAAPPKERVMYPLNFNQLPIEVKKISEQNVEHVRSFATGYIRFLQRSFQGLGASGEDTFSVKVLGYAEANVDSALDLTEALLAAKTVPEIWTLQNEFIQSQIRTVTEQARDLAGSAVKAIPGMAMINMAFPTLQPNAEGEHSTPVKPTFSRAAE